MYPFHKINALNSIEPLEDGEFTLFRKFFQNSFYFAPQRKNMDATIA